MTHKDGSTNGHTFEEILAVAIPAMRWLMGEMLDSRGERSNDPHIASHFCDFDYHPEYGGCSWHERWVDAADLCGLLEEWAEDETDRDHAEQVAEMERTGWPEIPRVRKS